jgi:hypothetical protein
MTVLNWAKSAFYVSLAVLFGFGSYFAWVATQTVQQVGQQTTSVLSQTSASIQQANASITRTSNALTSAADAFAGTAAGVNTALYKINTPCVPGPCGLLADTAKTLNTVRGTFGEVEIAARHEDKNLGVLDSQETQLFQDTHLVLTGLSSETTELHQATTDLDSFITSPDLNRTVHNFDTVTYNLGQTTGDFQTKFHQFLFPPPCKGFKCDLAKTFTIIKTGSSLAEPAYWGSQLFQSIR